METNNDIKINLEKIEKYKNCNFLKWVEQDEKLLIKINKNLTLTNIRREYFLFLKSIIDDNVIFKNHHFNGFIMYLSIFYYIDSFNDEEEIKKLCLNYFNFKKDEKETMNLIFLEPILKEHPELIYNIKEANESNTSN